MELLFALIGFAIARVGNAVVKRLPDDSKLKRHGAVIFGGGGPDPRK